VPPVVVSLFGAQFITWRGIPLVRRTGAGGGRQDKVILVRTGEERQGVVGLFQPAWSRAGAGAVGAVHRNQPVGDRDLPGHPLHVLAVLTDDALGVLDDVRRDQFHE